MHEKFVHVSVPQIIILEIIIICGIKLRKYFKDKSCKLSKIVL